MNGYVHNIEQAALENENFRQVLYTDKKLQLVVMSLRPHEEIGMETHDKQDQFIRIEQGTGKAVIAGRESIIKDGTAIIIPAGAEHNIINTSAESSMKLYTLYSPPHHEDGTIHKTKAEADASEESFDGKTTE